MATWSLFSKSYETGNSDLRPGNYSATPPPVQGGTDPAYSVSFTPDDGSDHYDGTGTGMQVPGRNTQGFPDPARLEAQPSVNAIPQPVTTTGPFLNSARLSAESIPENFGRITSDGGGQAERWWTDPPLYPAPVRWTGWLNPNQWRFMRPFGHTRGASTGQHVSMANFRLSYPAQLQRPWSPMGRNTSYVVPSPLDVTDGVEEQYDQNTYVSQTLPSGGFRSWGVS